jgi:pilus assembly protein CpaE
MTHAYGTRTLKITFLTVRVDEEIISEFLDSARERNWAVVEAAFDAYISAKRRPHFGEQLKSGDGCIALIDFDGNTEQAIEATAYLQEVFAGKIAIVALSAGSDPDLMLRAMRAGCTEFLTTPFDEEGLTAACIRLEQQILMRRNQAGAEGSIVAFFGAKGGVGTTTLAVHLATYLVQNNKKRVLLIDNHAQFGHACIYLGLDGSGYHFQELVRNVNRLDSELLLGFITSHGCGLDVLSSPDVGYGVRVMNAEDVASTLDFLRNEYDFVVVDCASVLDETNLAVIAAASQVYIVATPEIGAVRDLSRYIDDLLRIDQTTNKMKVVINRFSSQFAVSLAHIEKAVRLPVALSIPNSFIELVQSVNLGVPVAANRQSEFSRDIAKWANDLVGVSEPVDARSNQKVRFAKDFFFKRLFAFFNPSASPLNGEV